MGCEHAVEGPAFLRQRVSNSAAAVDNRLDNSKQLFRLPGFELSEQLTLTCFDDILAVFAGPTLLMTRSLLLIFPKDHPRVKPAKSGCSLCCPFFFLFPFTTIGTSKLAMTSRWEKGVFSSDVGSCPP